jgi:hypothetical protein
MVRVVGVHALDGFCIKSFDFIFLLLGFIFNISRPKTGYVKLGYYLVNRNVNGILTIVTEDTNEIALPFNTVSAPGRVVLFAGADNVTPLLAITFPTITPPPA